MGLCEHAMAPERRPLDPKAVIFWRARTRRYDEVAPPPEPGRNPYEIEMALPDDLKPGDASVFDCGGTARTASRASCRASACSTPLAAPRWSRGMRPSAAAASASARAT